MEEISITLGRFEHPSLEFKRDASDRGKICKAICALANDLAGRGGGDLLIGVDDTGAAYQVDISDEALLKITDIRDGGQILERPTMTVDRALWDGHEIIRVHVTGAVTPPIRFNGVVWVRPGPTTRSASANDEQVLAERRLQTVPFDSREVAGLCS